jgi:hypothetical protein
MHPVSAHGTYHGRRAACIENETLRVSVLEGGGHIAEILDKDSGINPLWLPAWRSIEPSAYDSAGHPEFGTGSEARLLAAIMGHNVCLDIFGGPSAEEEAAGLSAHGEAPVVAYEIEVRGCTLTMNATLPLAQLRFDREIVLQDRTVRIRERVENLAGIDRPIGWTQHVTLSPPFLEKGVTEFRSSAGRSMVYPGEFGAADYLEPGAEFQWPDAPRRRSGQPQRSVAAVADLRRFTGAPVSSAYTAHLMDPKRANAFFVAFSPRAKVAFGYVWKQADFPWMGIWEENLSRRHAPWNGVAITCGMEFGVSPMPESRREMIDRGRLFDVPTFRWIPARTRVEVEYRAVALHADSIPETLETP